VQQELIQLLLDQQHVLLVQLVHIQLVLVHQHAFLVQ
jgi:hypothetical protein